MTKNIHYTKRKNKPSIGFFSIDMKITYRTLGFAATNTYYIEKDNEVIVVDPCLDPNRDATRLLQPLKGKEVIAVLITHGHFDHISGIDAVVDKFNCPVYMYHEEIHYLKNPRVNLSNQVPEEYIIEAEVTPIHLEPLDIGSFEFDVIKTPGHTSGSVSYVLDNHVFDGDFIFEESVGRTDLPTGSMVALNEAIREFVDTYKDDMIILYPGHGNTTTLDEEIKRNYYVKQALK